MEWQRAYNEINEFEQMLLEDSTRLAKIFLHITPEEQMRRFRARLTDPLKRWKLSYEDFRNRARWKDYEVAIEDMFERTSTDRASWYLVPANNKPFSRLAASTSSPIGYRRVSLWSHRRLIPRWRRPLSNCLVSRYPRTTTVVIDPVQLSVSHDNAQRPMPPASWPPSTATNHNSSAFIGQLGWPNLQTGIAWFSARQAGQKICPQPEQRTPVLSGSNVCPHSEQHHSPDWIVNGILPNKCRLPEDLPYPIARSATTLWARSRTGSKSST